MEAAQCWQAAALEWQGHGFTVPSQHTVRMGVVAAGRKQGSRVVSSDAHTHV